MKRVVYRDEFKRVNGVGVEDNDAIIKNGFWLGGGGLMV
jgi:hypothetical protein